MWVGVCDEWTPDERRDCYRELEERVVKKEQKERDVKTEEEETKLSWMEMGLNNPLYKATFTQLRDIDAYVVELQEQRPSHPLATRNMMFEVVYPLYKGLNAILDKRTTSQTSLIKIQVSSRQHAGVTYTQACTPDTWSYSVMDTLMEGLSDQLSVTQDLNRGLLIQLSFIKKI